VQPFGEKREKRVERKENEREDRDRSIKKKKKRIEIEVGNKSPERRLNLNGSWHKGHSHAYNTPFYI
jgi:hypothetical protein